MTGFFGAFFGDLRGGCFLLSLGSDEIATLQSLTGSSLRELPMGLEVADSDVGKSDGVDRLEEASEKLGSVKRPSNI